MNYYKGWEIFGSGNEWCAWRFGVRIRGNSKQLIKTIIDLRYE